MVAKQLRLALETLVAVAAVEKPKSLIQVPAAPALLSFDIGLRNGSFCTD
jgi:hypothetical protein